MLEHTLASDLDALSAYALIGVPVRGNCPFRFEWGLQPARPMAAYSDSLLSAMKEEIRKID